MNIFVPAKSTYRKRYGQILYQTIIKKNDDYLISIRNVLNY